MCEQEHPQFWEAVRFGAAAAITVLAVSVISTATNFVGPFDRNSGNPMLKMGLGAASVERKRTVRRTGPSLRKQLANA
jgi:hypothetical protein